MTRSRLHQALRLVLQKHERQLLLRCDHGIDCCCSRCLHAATLVDAAIAEFCGEFDATLQPAPDPADPADPFIWRGM